MEAIQVIARANLPFKWCTRLFMVKQNVKQIKKDYITAKSSYIWGSGRDEIVAY